MTAPTATEPFTIRQSTLASFSRCPLSARFELDLGDYHSQEMARGTLAHRCAEEILRTLHRTGEAQMPQEEGLQIMHEVLAQQDVPSEEVLVISAEEHLNLRQFVVRFCSDWEWDTARIITLEHQLTADITCPDGVVRRITGTPDALIAEPATSTIVIPDWKSGWGPPKVPSEHAYNQTTGELAEPRRYLTERGHFQLDAYGYLALANYPRVARAMLREIHPRASEKREAFLRREEMPDVEARLGAYLMLMDRALAEDESGADSVTGEPLPNGARMVMEGGYPVPYEGPQSPIWKAMPGRHCAWCVNRPGCPRPSASRGVGRVESLEHAAELAADTVKASADREADSAALKAWVAEHGPVLLPDGRYMAWAVTHDPETGAEGRVFGPCYRSEFSEHQYVTKSGHRRELLAKWFRDVGLVSPSSGWGAKAIRVALDESIYADESDSAHQGDLRVLCEEGVLVKDGRPARYWLAPTP